jgi:nucleotide-binding universal stress UspA family protein
LPYLSEEKPESITENVETIRMKNILFPTDFSANAHNALVFALELAKTHSAKLFLLNAYQLPYNRADMMLSVLDILKEDSEAGLKQTMEEIRNKPEFSMVALETLSKSGDVVSTVSEAVSEHDIDLVIMGSKGESGVLEKLIGSNSSSVIKNITTPALIVPEFAKYRIPQKIALSYDLKDIENPQDIRFLASAAKTYGAEIQVFSIISETDSAKMEKADIKLKLDNYFSGIKTEMYFNINGDIIEGLQTLIKENQPDWLAMIAKKYTLFESLFHTSMTREMVFQSDKPMLILHNYTSK